MTEIKFPNGLIAKKPSEKAPDFLKAKISIKSNDLINWIKLLSKEWINLDLLESKDGKFYFKVDEFEPKKQELPSMPENDDLPF